MSITARELATKLGVSPSAVSFALNDKPGVSTELKKRILVEAEKNGYDFSRIRKKEKKTGTLLFIVYKKSGAVVDDTPFFSKLSDGIKKKCAEDGFTARMEYLYKSDLTARSFEDISYSGCDGLLILGTEMESDDLLPFEELGIPLVLLDNSFIRMSSDAIVIDNVQGAYLATTHLMQKYRSQPGYLKSVYRINNFTERADGFYKAIRANGRSASKSIVHELSPSVDGAYEDMKVILQNKEPLARCYFADNDLIAIGAMKAVQESGRKIPDDVAIVGFDNLPISKVLDLSTVNVPVEYMGEQAAHRLIEYLENPGMPRTKTLISTDLVERYTS
ncbi:MAG: LacI family DNA-binding transcriptional regulator [Blautia sp.]|nr:LacI family DNA-binding transcriptional regulator [Blautia sp.]